MMDGSRTTHNNTHTANVHQLSDHQSRTCQILWHEPMCPWTPVSEQSQQLLEQVLANPYASFFKQMKHTQVILLIFNGYKITSYLVLLLMLGVYILDT